MHPINAVEYAEGLALQAAVLRELQAHAHRLVGRLPWMTDDVADLVTTLDNLASGRR